MGTPTYMSPEQVRDVKDIDKRSDIYSLGVTLYFMLTGSAPYNSNTLSTFDIYNKIVHEPLPPLTSNIQFNEIIAKATAKNPNDRYSSCKVMADAFTADQKTAKKPEQSEDDEKTLFITEPVTPANTKKTSIKPKPAVPEPKPHPAFQQPKTAPIISGESKKRFSKKQLIIAAAGVLALIGAMAFFTMSVFTGSSRLTNAVDSISYSLGVIEGQYLKEKFDTINLPAIEKGIMNPSEYSDNDIADQEVMFKYIRNNLKNHQYNKNECDGFFAKYGSTLAKNAKGDMIYDLQNKLFFAGLKHVVTGNDLKISFNDAVTFANSFPTTASKMAALNNVAVEKAFFKDLKNNSRIKQASKGVFYEIVSDGSGSSPNANSNVSLKMIIKNLNGDVLKNIDNNYYTINFLIPGLQEVLQKMKKGSVYRIYVPSQAAYGVLGLFDSIKPYQALICEAEMVTFYF